MQIYLCSGDIFSTATKHSIECIVNTVNTKGVSGAGLALDFKLRYPLNYNLYKEYCNTNSLLPGGVFLTLPEDNGSPFIIANAATKDHWKNQSEYHWIRNICSCLTILINKGNVKSILIPPLGCGLGKLNRETVKNIIISSLGSTKLETLYLINF